MVLSEFRAILLIIDDVMVIIFIVFDVNGLDYCMFWVVRCLVYFGFFSFAEFIIFNLVSFILFIYFGVVDIFVDFYLSFLCFRIRIKVFKTDLFRKGCFMYIGRGSF